MSSLDRRMSSLEDKVNALNLANPANVTSIAQLASLANTRALTAAQIGVGNAADISSLVNAPYFMKAQLLEEYAGFDDIFGERMTIPGMTESFAATTAHANPHFGDWNTTTDTWDCPATGFYNITASVHVTSRNTDRLQIAIVDILIINALGEKRTIANGGLNQGTENASEGHAWVVTCNTLDLVLDTDKVEFKIAWLVGSGTVHLREMTGHFQFDRCSALHF